MAASYGVPLPDVSDLIRGFHFEDYANVLLSVADLLPLPAIALARGVAAREMLVLPLRFLAMLLTVLLAVLAKVRAAGVAAGASWFSRHACRLLSDNRKAPKGCSFRGSSGPRSPSFGLLSTMGAMGAYREWFAVTLRLQDG